MSFRDDLQRLKNNNDTFSNTLLANIKNNLII